MDTEAVYAVVALGYVSSDESKQEAPANKASDLNTAAGWLLSSDFDKLPDRLQGLLREHWVSHLRQASLWMFHGPQKTISM